MTRSSVRATNPNPVPTYPPPPRPTSRRIGAEVEDLFYHVLAVLHDPAYRESNAGALRMEWPRIPLPGWPDGIEDGAAETLAESAAPGREIARLLDSESDVPGVTSGALRPEIAAIAVPATTDNRNMSGDDFYLEAGWGHFGAGQAVMPGQGSSTERDYTSDERAALSDSVPVLGETTFDIYLNDRAYWKNVPSAVWNYKLGGYQVLKKWLSYRERQILGRRLTPEEVQHFTDTARRIAGLLLLVTSNEIPQVHKLFRRWGALSVTPSFQTLAVGITIAIVFWGWFREGPTNVESNGATIRLSIGLIIGGAVALVFGIWRTVVAQ